MPNDVILDYEKQRLMIITGPNFSGKSSLLRATALIVIMAHMGCYVPANKLELSGVDRIFTRIGRWNWSGTTAKGVDTGSTLTTERV